MTHAQRHMINAIKERYEASVVDIAGDEKHGYRLQVRVPTIRDYDKRIVNRPLQSDTKALAIEEAYNYAMNGEPIKRQNTAYREVVGVKC